MISHSIFTTIIFCIYFFNFFSVIDCICQINFFSLIFSCTHFSCVLVLYTRSHNNSSLSFYSLSPLFVWVSSERASTEFSRENLKKPLDNIGLLCKVLPTLPTIDLNEAFRTRASSCRGIPINAPSTIRSNWCRCRRYSCCYWHYWSCRCWSWWRWNDRWSRARRDWSRQWIHKRHNVMFRTGELLLLCHERGIIWGWIKCIKMIGVDMTTAW